MYVCIHKVHRERVREGEMETERKVKFMYTKLNKASKCIHTQAHKTRTFKIKFAFVSEFLHSNNF